MVWLWCIHNSILNVGPVYLATMWTVHCSSHISHQLRLDFEDTEVVRTLGEVKKTYHSPCSGWHSMIQWMKSTSQVAIPARFKLNKYQYKKTFSNQSKYHWMLASRLPAILGPDCVQPGWRTAQHGESTVEKKRVLSVTEVQCNKCCKWRFWTSCLIVLHCSPRCPLSAVFLKNQLIIP